MFTDLPKRVARIENVPFTVIIDMYKTPHLKKVKNFVFTFKCVECRMIYVKKSQTKKFYICTIHWS